MLMGNSDIGLIFVMLSFCFVSLTFSSVYFITWLCFFCLCSWINSSFYVYQEHLSLFFAELVLFAQRLSTVLCDGTLLLLHWVALQVMSISVWVLFHTGWTFCMPHKARWVSLADWGQLVGLYQAQRGHQGYIAKYSMLYRPSTHATCHTTALWLLWVTWWNPRMSWDVNQGCTDKSNMPNKPSAHLSSISQLFEDDGWCLTRSGVVHQCYIARLSILCRACLHHRWYNKAVKLLVFTGQGPTRAWVHSTLSCFNENLHRDYRHLTTILEPLICFPSSKSLLQSIRP